jgi:hypothetical protein
MHLPSLLLVEERPKILPIKFSGTQTELPSVPFSTRRSPIKSSSLNIARLDDSVERRFCKAANGTGKSRDIATSAVGPDRESEKAESLAGQSHLLGILGVIHDPSGY